MKLWRYWLEERSREDRKYIGQQHLTWVQSWADGGFIPLQRSVVGDLLDAGRHAPHSWSQLQVAEHCAPQDCWVSVFGTVYDVSELLKVRTHYRCSAQARPYIKLPPVGAARPSGATPDCCSRHRYLTLVSCMGCIGELRRFKQAHPALYCLQV